MLTLLIGNKGEDKMSALSVVMVSVAQKGPLFIHPTMLRADKKWQSLLLLFVCSCLLLQLGCYDVEEAARRVNVRITWLSDTSVKSVRYRKFSQFEEANKFVTSSENCVDSISLRNGDTIKITRLKSGFNNIRILDPYVAITVEFTSGKYRRFIVELDETKIEKRKIDLGKLSEEAKGNK